MIKILLKYKYSILWVTIMLVCCTIKIDMPKMDKDSFHLQIPHFDKIVHCVIFMILTALICIETRYVELSNKIKILIISALFGFTIEVIQYFEPWRSFDLWDLAADILGAYLGILMSKYLITRIYK